MYLFNTVLKTSGSSISLKKVNKVSKSPPPPVLFIMNLNPASCFILPSFINHANARGAVAPSDLYKFCKSAYESPKLTPLIHSIISLSANRLACLIIIACGTVKIKNFLIVLISYLSINAVISTSNDNLYQ